MPGGQLNADVDGYLAAAGMNVPPPPIPSDPLVAGSTPIEQLLRILGLAANVDDPLDDAESVDQHARRDAEVTAAADRFAAQDQNAASAMAQQIPQLASGIAGALTGAMQTFTQIPQQLTQGAQQAIQSMAGAFQSGGPVTGFDDVTASPATDDIDTAADDVEYDGPDLSQGTLPAGPPVPLGGGSLGPTSPTAALGPPPVPSAGTSPAAAPNSTAPATAPAATRTNTGGTMAGTPLIPPGVPGGTAAGEKDVKTDTKRVSVPTVRNGAPVQGRLMTPPPVGPLTTGADGKAVSTRRIVVPHPGAGPP